MAWTDILLIASPTIALISVFFVRRSSRTAREALNLAYKTGQLSYETARVASNSPVDLFLTGIEYRNATVRDAEGFIGEEAQRCVDHEDSECLEVVVKGRLVNNSQNEILLTCHDHPESGRKIWYSHRNQSIFFIEGIEVIAAHALLNPGQEATFEWIDHRKKDEWIDIHNLHARNILDRPELSLPELSWIEGLRAFARRDDLLWTRRKKVKRSGFRIVCEPRTLQRVAAIWEAEVVKTPVEMGEPGKNGRITFNDHIGSISGPLDDRVIHYRLDFDATLAQIDPPTNLWLKGRSAGLSYPS